MDVLLLSNRGYEAPHWSEAWALAAARELAANGARVRWLRAATAAFAAPPPLPAGVEVATIVGEARPFRRVEGRIDDPRVDTALTRLLRPRPSDIVHHFGFGAPGSGLATWLADRMGSHAVATVRARELLCHRQTLVDERGATCRTLGEADRCTTCCCTPTPPGLSPGQARAGRLLRWLRGCSPFPHHTGFLNRFDLLAGGLQVCSAVMVPSALDDELLLSTGFVRAAAVVPDDAAAAARLLPPLYAALAVSPAEA
jgi:hypothetical protein